MVAGAPPAPFAAAASCSARTPTFAAKYSATAVSYAAVCAKASPASRCR